MKFSHIFILVICFLTFNTFGQSTNSKNNRYFGIAIEANASERFDPGILTALTLDLSRHQIK